MAGQRGLGFDRDNRFEIMLGWKSIEDGILFPAVCSVAILKTFIIEDREDIIVDKSDHDPSLAYEGRYFCLKKQS